MLKGRWGLVQTQNSQVGIIYRESAIKIEAGSETYLGCQADNGWMHVVYIWEE